jgi:hypothetical protein
MNLAARKAAVNSGSETTRERAANRFVSTSPGFFQFSSKIPPATRTDATLNGTLS